MIFHIHNVHEITMFVKLCPLQLQFQNVMMGVGKILWSPISADEKMPCDEIPLYSKFIHRSPPLSRFYRSHDRSPVFFGNGHGKIERVDFCAIVKIRGWKLREIWIKMKERIAGFVHTINIRSGVCFLTS